MKKDNKKKVETPKKRLPKKVWMMLIYLVIFPVVLISTFFLTTYFANRVSPFKDEIAAIEETGVKVKHYEYNKFDDFELIFYADKFKTASNKEQVQFKVAAYEEHLPGFMSSSIKVQVAMAANWIGFYEKSSSRTLSYKPTESQANSSKVTLQVNNVIDFPARKNIINIKTPETYLLLEYSTKEDGKITKYASVVHFPYGSYEVKEGGLDL